MKSTSFGRAIAALAASLAFAGNAIAAEPAFAKGRTVGGIEFHYGVAPARAVKKHPSDQPERTMHGGAGTQSHVVLALFEAGSGIRISEAKVRATVTPLGGLPVTKRLEAMPIAGKASFGNYFPLTAPGVYRIRFEVDRPGTVGTVAAEFEYRVAPR